MKLPRAYAQYIFTLLIGCLSTATVPTTAYAQSYDIGLVTVEGNQSVETALILSVSGLYPGVRLSATVIQEAIRRIYALELFEDVRVDGEYAGGKANLRIVVKEHPRLRAIKFSGNKNIKSDDLKSELKLYERQMTSPAQIRRAEEALRARYRKDGYHQAEVVSKIQEVGEREIEITFDVKEREKVKIRAIEFYGNEIFANDKLRGKMKLKPKAFFRSGSFSREQLSTDKEKLIDFYRKNGYIEAAVAADSIEIDPDGRRMVLKLWMTEGDQFFFGDVTFTGNEVYNDEYLHKQIKFDAGDVFNHDKFEKSVGNLYSVYQEQGYLHVRIYDNVRSVDTTLNIEFEISEGVPAHINLVSIEGNTKTKEKVIRRELFSRPGQVFSRSALMRSMRNVMLLNYFANVEPDIRNLPNGDVDLIFKVKEKPTGQIQAGAGYSGQDKLVGTIGLGIPNFRGNGQNVNLDWSFGKRRNSIALSFTEPWLLDTPTLLGFDVYNINRLLQFGAEEFAEGNRGLGVRVGRRLRWPDDYFRTTVRYTLEQLRYYDFNDAYREANKDNPNSLERFNNRWLTTSVVGWTITRDSRDLSQFATSGSLFQLNNEISGWALGGDWKYYKSQFDAAKYTRIWWKFVLAAKMRVGVVDSPLGDKGIPYTERFAPGGTYPDGMIRGYEDGSVVPRDARGANLRGRSLLVYNLELQFPIAEQTVYALAFADAGNSWLAGRYIKPFDLDRHDGLKKSVGFGFRVVIPGLGTIGFDFGYGYNNPAGAGWKTHFQIGQSF